MPPFTAIFFPALATFRLIFLDRVFASRSGHLFAATFEERTADNSPMLKISFGFSMKENKFYFLIIIHLENFYEKTFDKFKFIIDISYSIVYNKYLIGCIWIFKRHIISSNNVSNCVYIEKMIR